MELDKIMQMLKGKTEPKLVRFISDKGPNSCKDCLKHHGQIFCADAPDKPKLPIHPNCRCKYELLTQEESMICQENMQQVKRQLVDYGNQIAAQATQLLEEYENKIKTRVITSTTNGVVTALTAALQVSLWTMKKIDQSDKFLQEKMENTGINPVLAELKSWFLPMQKIEKSLKKWHYDRLNNPMQQAWALPQSQEEAIRRGFFQAPESQNFLPPK